MGAMGAMDFDGGKERTNGPLFSPRAPFTLPEYKTARARHAQFCSIEIKRLLL